MKAKITSVSDNTIVLLCSSHPFKEGDNVIIEDATKGSNNQNRLFHELINIWISSGCSSYEGDLKKVKDFVKRDLGQGFESYIYAYQGLIVQVKTEDAIPDWVPKGGKLGKLKSWADYTKKQRKDCISNLIDNMVSSGVNSQKFEDICEELYA